METRDNTGNLPNEVQPSRTQIGFWKSLGLVLKIDIEDTKDDGAKHVVWAFVAGLVVPALLAVMGILDNQVGIEAMKCIGGAYVALTTLFALLTLRKHSTLDDEIKAVMPPLIVSAAVTGVLLPVVSFIIFYSNL